MSVSTLDRRAFVTGIAAAPLAASVPTWVWAQAPFETVQFFVPDEVLPPDLITGDLFKVVGQVIAQGYYNRYTLRTDFELEEINTQDLLTKRIHEAAAIAEILKVKDTDAFTAGAANAAKSPYKALKALVNDPVNTLMGVPEGFWKLAKRVGEMVTGDRGDREDHAAAELVGFSTIKRKLAFKLGVDVYSSNRRLQQEMNEVAFAGFAGGMTMNLAIGAVAMPSALNTTIDAVEVTRTASQIIRDSAPEDLRLRNQDSWLMMGASDKQIDKFLNNDHYSPRHETIITLAMESMDGVDDRNEVARSARHAESLVEAQLMQRRVEMFRSYHAQVSPAAAFVDVDDNLGMRTQDGRLVMAMPADRLLWTKDTEPVVDALAGYGGEGITAREILVAGSVSDRARQQVEAKGIVLTENTRADLLPQEEWRPPELEVEAPPEDFEVDDPAPADDLGPVEEGEQPTADAS